MDLLMDIIITTTCFILLAVIVEIHFMPPKYITHPYYSQETKYMSLNHSMKAQILKTKEKA